LPEPKRDVGERGRAVRHGEIDQTNASGRVTGDEDVARGEVSVDHERGAEPVRTRGHPIEHVLDDRSVGGDTVCAAQARLEPIPGHSSGELFEARNGGTVPRHIELRCGVVKSRHETADLFEVRRRFPPEHATREVADESPATTSGVRRARAIERRDRDRSRKAGARQRVEDVVFPSDLLRGAFGTVAMEYGGPPGDSHAPQRTIPGEQLDRTGVDLSELENLDRWGIDARTVEVLCVHEDANVPRCSIGSSSVVRVR
jgi:hypothetical protein